MPYGMIFKASSIFSLCVSQDWRQSENSPPSLSILAWVWAAATTLLYCPTEYRTNTALAKPSHFNLHMHYNKAKILLTP